MFIASETIEFRPFYIAIVVKCLAPMRRRHVPIWSMYGNPRAYGRRLLVARLPHPVYTLWRPWGSDRSVSHNGQYQRTTFHSGSRHEMAIRVGFATRLARGTTGATCVTRIRWVTVASKITPPAPPLKVLIVQLTHPAKNSRA